MNNQLKNEKIKKKNFQTFLQQINQKLPIKQSTVKKGKGLQSVKKTSTLNNCSIEIQSSTKKTKKSPKHMNVSHFNPEQTLSQSKSKANALLNSTILNQSSEIADYFIKREIIQNKNFIHIQNWLLFNIENKECYLEENTLSQNFIKIPPFTSHLKNMVSENVLLNIEKLQPIQDLFLQNQFDQAFQRSYQYDKKDDLFSSPFSEKDKLKTHSLSNDFNISLEFKKQQDHQERILESKSFIHDTVLKTEFIKPGIKNTFQLLQQQISKINEIKIDQLESWVNSITQIFQEIEKLISKQKIDQSINNIKQRFTTLLEKHSKLNQKYQQENTIKNSTLSEISEMKESINILQDQLSQLENDNQRLKEESQHFLQKKNMVENSLCQISEENIILEKALKATKEQMQNLIEKEYSFKYNFNTQQMRLADQEKKVLNKKQKLQELEKQNNQRDSEKNKFENEINYLKTKISHQKKEHQKKLKILKEFEEQKENHEAQMQSQLQENQNLQNKITTNQAFVKIISKKLKNEEEELIKQKYRLSNSEKIKQEYQSKYQELLNQLKKSNEASKNIEVSEIFESLYLKGLSLIQSFNQIWKTLQKVSFDEHQLKINEKKNCEISIEVKDLTKKIKQHEIEIQLNIREQEVLQNLRSTLHSDLADLRKKKSENEIVNKFLQEEISKDQDDYVDVIYQELCSVKKVQEKKTVLYMNQQRKISNIFDSLGENRRIDDFSRNEQHHFFNEANISQISIEKDDKSLNSIFINNSMVSDNIYGLAEKNSKIPTKITPLSKTLKETCSLGYFPNLNMTSMSRKNLQLEQRENELQNKWKWMVKFFQTMLNSLFKSSCLLSNLLSQLLNSPVKKEHQRIKLKQNTMLFLKSSVERHEKCFSKINAYKNIQQVNFKALLSCMSKIKEMVQQENQIQESFNKDIKEVIKSV